MFGRGDMLGWDDNEGGDWSEAILMSLPSPLPSPLRYAGQVAKPDRLVAPQDDTLGREGNNENDLV